MNLEQQQKKFQVLKIILEIDQFDNLGVWELYPILRTIFSSIINKIVCRKKNSLEASLLPLQNKKYVFWWVWGTRN